MPHGCRAGIRIVVKVAAAHFPVLISDIDQADILQLQDLHPAMSDGVIQRESVKLHRVFTLSFGKRVGLWAAPGAAHLGVHAGDGQLTQRLTLAVKLLQKSQISDLIFIIIILDSIPDMDIHFEPRAAACNCLRVTYLVYIGSVVGRHAATNFSGTFPPFASHSSK
jgi:hypothetical protein